MPALSELEFYDFLEELVSRTKGPLKVTAEQALAERGIRRIDSRLFQVIQAVALNINMPLGIGTEVRRALIEYQANPYPIQPMPSLEDMAAAAAAKFRFPR